MSNKQVEKLKYQFRAGAHIKGAKPDVVAGEITRIANENGGLDAPLLVNEARPHDAPLHPCFEWNDKKAGEQYRVYQARKLIKSVEVVTEDAPAQPLISYCPQIEKETEKGNYQLTSVVVARPDYFASAMTELVKRVKSAQEAVEALQQAAARENETDADRLARIGMAVKALEMAGKAVQALH